MSIKGLELSEGQQDVAKVSAANEKARPMGEDGRLEKELNYCQEQSIARSRHLAVNNYSKIGRLTQFQ
jgi:hypothetical protein